MRIARVRVAELATPVLALVVDGAHYAVDRLDALWSRPEVLRGGDFSARVVSARAVGLHELDARLRAGDRPTEARLLPQQYLPLPPCDPERAAYLQMGPYDLGFETPRFQRRDSRSLVGHEQPVALLAPAGPHVEAGMAVVLADELWRASAPEAARAILGFTLILDWATGGNRWDGSDQEHVAPSQLGPELLIGPSTRDLAALAAELSIASKSSPCGRVGAWRFQPAESLAFLSQQVPLRAGDVIGVGCFAGGRASAQGGTLGWGERVRVAVARTMALEGWAVPAREPGPWRLEP